jgi:hypothetical protein
MQPITITHVYQTLADLGVVASQREFSRYIGRGESWFSSAVARNRQDISTESLLALTQKLDESISLGIDSSLDEAETPEDRLAYKTGSDELVELKADIELIIESRIKTILN